MELKKTKSASAESVEATIRELFESAHQSLWISTALSTKLVNDLKGPFLAALDRVADSRVLLDPDVDVSEATKQFDWLFHHDRCQIQQSKVPIRHWIISDGLNFRIEDEHVPGAPLRDNLTIKNCDPMIAGVLLDRFQAMWANSVPVHKS